MSDIAPDPCRGHRNCPGGCSDPACPDPAPMPNVTLEHTSHLVLREAGAGDRLYAIDENGDGWRIIVEGDLTDDVLPVQVTCDTLRVDEWSNWRHALVHVGTFSLAWTEQPSASAPADTPPREHVLALVGVVLGWS